MASMIAIICPFLVFLRAITIFQIFGQEVTEKQIEKQELPKKLDGAYELYNLALFLYSYKKQVLSSQLSFVSHHSFRS